LCGVAVMSGKWPAGSRARSSEVGEADADESLDDDEGAGPELVQAAQVGRRLRVDAQAEIDWVRVVPPLEERRTAWQSVPQPAAIGAALHNQTEPRVEATSPPGPSFDAVRRSAVCRLCRPARRSSAADDGR